MTFLRTSVAPVVQITAVVDWHRGSLLERGAPRIGPLGSPGTARSNCNAVLELIDRACPLELAARILALLGDDRRRC
jgi:hypothetical protein